MMINQREIVREGYQALIDVLDTVNAIRFIQYFSSYQVNYTQERCQQATQYLN